MAHLFGVRHLSPAGAYHLLRLLDDVKPTAVLVEGPSDATPLIASIVRDDVKPPIALLAYTEEVPVRTLLYPLASYSPEYQAFVWSAKHGAEASFIDLPSYAALALHRPAAAPEGRERYARLQRELYEGIAARAGEPDYDTYWERRFESNLEPEAYRAAIHELSAAMRAWLEPAELADAPEEAAYNAVREAYMRRSVEQAIRNGHDPSRIVVVTGAYHVSAFRDGQPAMTDEEAAALPRADTKLTLMPYTYYKLSTQSGYGAGNRAPAYFELLWRHMRRGEPAGLPSRYLAMVAERQRESGMVPSTASVIEAVRLAEALASLHDGPLPALKDLRDAAIATLGGGELSAVAGALAAVDVGTAIGSLPEGISRTPLQDDFNRELKALKLEKYKAAVPAELDLDLRENRRVGSEAAAFLDLRRSFFLQRLRLLDVGFAQQAARRQDGAAWAERWIVRWSPEVEIGLVESNLKGETIELAAAFELKERLERCGDIREAAKLVRIACDCGLPAAAEEALHAAQRLAVDDDSVPHLAAAARQLSLLLQFGDVRRIDTTPLAPLLRQLFVRAALLLVDAAACNDQAAVELSAAIGELHEVSVRHDALADGELWIGRLEELAARDDRNPKLSGLAFSLLLEQNRISAERTEREVSRRLSPGIPSDIGAGWFEGLAMRNRYGLLSRPVLWERLDRYVGELDDEQFRRALVFLRRAFGGFEPRERAAIAELLGDLWGYDAGQVGEAVQRELTEQEQAAIDELNEFDFGDL